MTTPMEPDTPEPTLRIANHRASLASPIGHPVRSKIEARLCQWLIDRDVAHRHGAEIFTVRLGRSQAPYVYVPDIMLHDRREDGRTIIIECLANSAPRMGGTKLLTGFRQQSGKGYYLIVVAHGKTLESVPRSACDALVDFKHLDLLAKKIPIP